MDISDIEQIGIIFGSFGTGALIGAGTIYLLLKSFIPSYLSEKGRNLATKEDIAEITEKVESIRADHAKMIEEVRSNNQLKLAEIEREKNIRKEVYLQAVEALVRAINVVPNLLNLDANDQEFSAQMANDSGVIAKVQIVGSESTVTAVTAIMSLIGSTILELILERSTLIERKKHIEVLEGLRSKEQSEIERYISIMKNINLEGNRDQRLWETINQNVVFETKQRDHHIEEIDKLWSIQNKEHLKFAKKCMEKFFEISSNLPAVTLSVRDDLNLPISNDAYLDIFNNNIEMAKQVFDRFYGQLQGNDA